MKNRSFFDLLFLCLQSKCPVCAEGKLFARFWSFKSDGPIFLPLEYCSVCGFKFNREPGYLSGCFFPILPIIALFVAALFAATAYFILKLDPDEIVVATLLGAVVGFIIFFRTAIAIFIAIDHAIHPTENKEKT